jgi:CPA2 family monovalent cation:H+ antiporter-2
VALPAGAYACRMRLKDLDMTHHKVQVKSIRRPNTKGLSPAPEVILAEGDMVVLQGTPDNLSSAATFLLTGK